MHLNDWFSEFSTHACLNPGVESCGFLLHDGANSLSFCRTANISATPDKTFVISAEEQAAFHATNRVAALVHSHIGDDDEQPSEADIQCSDHAELPFVIYSLKTQGWSFHTPPACVQPWEGRPFVLGYSDCATLVGDLLATKGMKLPYYARNMHTLRSGFLRAVASLRGFSCQRVSAHQPGDVVLFQIGTCEHPNHTGMVDKDGRLLHQLMGQYSVAEEFTDGWRKRIHSVWRPPQNIYA